MISSNGQCVAFVSTGTNLVTNALEGSCHVYVRNIQAGATDLLDADTNGVGVGVDASLVPALSADGCVAVFDCLGNCCRTTGTGSMTFFRATRRRGRSTWFRRGTRPCCP